MSSTCSRILIDPLDSQTIHVSGGGGYTRTTDGAANWTLTFAGSRTSDLEMKAGETSA